MAVVSLTPLCDTYTSSIVYSSLLVTEREPRLDAARLLSANNRKSWDAGWRWLSPVAQAPRSLKLPAAGPVPSYIYLIVCNFFLEKMAMDGAQRRSASLRILDDAALVLERLDMCTWYPPG
jgi:hypothetical protein